MPQGRRTRAGESAAALSPGKPGLFDARLVFARGHADIFFEYVIEMGERIETQLFRDFRKGAAHADKFFRFVRFQLEIGAVNAHARLFAEEGAKIGLAVMQPGAEVVQLESVVQMFGEDAHDFVLQIGGGGNFRDEKFLRGALSRSGAQQIDEQQLQRIFDDLLPAEIGALAQLQPVEVGVEIGNDEGLRGLGHDVLQEIAVIFGHGEFFVAEKAHAFRTAFKGDDENIRLLFSAFHKMGLIGLDEYHFPLEKGGPFPVPDDKERLFVCIDDLPEVMRLLLRDVSRGQFLIVYRHDFLDVEKIRYAVHVKPLCLCPFFHAFIIAERGRVCKIFRASFLRNIL